MDFFHCRVVVSTDSTHGKDTFICKHIKVNLIKVNLASHDPFNAFNLWLCALTFVP